MSPSSNIPDWEWEQYKTEIQSFFPPWREKPVPLKDIMSYMQTKYRFYASIPQWKRRLEKWECTKKRNPEGETHDPGSHEVVVTDHRSPLQCGESMGSTNTYRQQSTRFLNFTPDSWFDRFMTRSFEHHINDGTFTSANLLFDHLQLPSRSLSSLTEDTKTMTMALFMLQTLGLSMPKASKDVFKECCRHISILRDSASDSIRRDFSAFIRIAAFFLQINGISSTSGPRLLPILAGCLHDVCEEAVGYDHGATVLFRYFALSVMFGESLVHDVTPIEWRLLLEIQALALLCWLKREDDRQLPGFQRLRIMHVASDVVTMCGVPDALGPCGLRLKILFARSQEMQTVQESSKVDSDPPIISEINMPLGSDWLSDWKLQRMFSGQTVPPVRFAVSSPKLQRHSKLARYRYVSQCGTFSIDQTNNEKVTGEFRAFNKCWHLEVRKGSNFHIILNQIIVPDCISHLESSRALVTPRGSLIRAESCLRLWFSLAQYMSGCTDTELRKASEIKVSECYPIYDGDIYVSYEMVCFWGHNFCMHNIDDFWPVLFRFLEPSSQDDSRYFPRGLKISLHNYTSSSAKTKPFCCLDHAHDPQTGFAKFSVRSERRLVIIKTSTTNPAGAFITEDVSL